MQPQQIVVDGYFDGCHSRRDGPYTITLQAGVIDAIVVGEAPADGVVPIRAGFLMPGLVEAHSHLFLDGAELDPARRAAYLRAPRDDMLAVGRRSLERSRAAGVTLVRDAGDIHGINLQLRDELRSSAPAGAGLLCAGRAIRNARRYGGFMAQELTDQTSPERLVAELAPQADQIKILMTGIIDFEAGEVTGPPQFTLEQASRIVLAAKAHGRRTFAHCSGAAGIDLALAAGIDSIEHGFFVTREQLRIMADRAVAWVPTFSPVHFQSARPEIAGWNAKTVDNLARILDQHRRQLDYAYAIGVPVLVGSDAGSIGVPHGRACIDEIILMAGAGVDLRKILHSATVQARALWGCEPVDIALGRKADLLLFDRSPFDDITALYDLAAVVQGERISKPQCAALDLPSL